MFTDNAGSILVMGTILALIVFTLLLALDWWRKSALANDAMFLLKLISRLFAILSCLLIPLFLFGAILISSLAGRRVAGADLNKFVGDHTANESILGILMVIAQLYFGVFLLLDCDRHDKQRGLFRAFCGFTLAALAIELVGAFRAADYLETNYHITNYEAAQVNNPFAALILPSGYFLLVAFFLLVARLISNRQKKFPNSVTPQTELRK